MNDFIVFNKETAGNKNSTKEPFITFSPKGMISLNSATLKLLEIDDKSKMIFLKKKDGSDWYIAKSTDKDAFTFRPLKNTSSAAFNSSKLVAAFFESVKGKKNSDDKLINEKKSIKAKINSTSIELEKIRAFLILTSSLRQ